MPQAVTKYKLGQEEGGEDEGGDESTLSQLAALQVNVRDAFVAPPGADSSTSSPNLRKLVAHTYPHFSQLAALQFKLRNAFAAPPGALSPQLPLLLTLAMPAHLHLHRRKPAAQCPTARTGADVQKLLTRVRCSTRIISCRRCSAWDFDGQEL